MDITDGMVRRLFMTLPKSSRLSISTVKDPLRVSLPPSSSFP